MLNRRVQAVKLKLRNYSKVIENYFFLTLMQFLSSMFGILIYPFLIRKLGAETYGLYVLALSVSNYFIIFIKFGFNFPGLKTISEKKEDKDLASKTLSEILSAQFFLSAISVILFCVLIFSIPVLSRNKLLFFIVFAQIFGTALFPTWYFQAIQKMKFVTYIQLFFRIASLPFIFVGISQPEDLNFFALVTSLTIIFPTFLTFVILIKKYDLGIRFVGLKQLSQTYKTALPFFYTNFAGVVKEESLTSIIAGFFGLADVALYDLANKIIRIPRMLTMSINASLFPKIIENRDRNKIRKIVRYEALLGLGISLIIILLAYPAVLILGGEKMTPAYPMAIILSFTIPAWLIVGSYINFVFVPTNRHYIVTKNQFVALFSFFLFLTPLFFYHDIRIAILAITLSGFAEIIYSRYQTIKLKLL